MGRKALITSIVLNVFLFASVLGLGYGWPLFIHVKQVLPERERRVSFFAEFPVRPIDIVFVGDELTDEARWTELFSGRPVKNRGVANDSSEDLAFRIGQISTGKPAKLFLMVGGNDIAAELEPHATAASHKKILEQIRRESPQTQIFVQSILPRGMEMADGIRERNRAIQKVAQEAGATYVDLFPLFVDEEGGMRADLSNDHIHLLSTGYKVWRDAILHQIGGQESDLEAEASARSGASETVPHR